MKKSRRKTPDKLALRIARAQLRAVRQAVGHFTTAPMVVNQLRSDPPQFIQCWAVGRGYSGVTQALDSAGQVWERYTKGAKDSAGAYIVEESYWVPLAMERRERKETA